MAKAKATARSRPAAKKQKKPAAKQRPAKQPASAKKRKPARRRARAREHAPTIHVPVGPARQRVRDTLAWVEDFADECKRLATIEGPLPWEHARTLELVGLERWGTDLARTDREAGVCALVLAAQLGRSRGIAPMVAAQLDRCARWVDAPCEENRQAVEDGFEPTRPSHAWDDGELGQLASAAIVKSERGDAASGSYYHWPAAVSVGRGLVVAVRGLCGPGDDAAAGVRELYAALMA